MREERGHIAGNITIAEPYTLWVSIGGDVLVSDGSKFYVRGAIYGNMNVAPGGRVHALGNITGNVTVSPKSKVILGGTVGGDVINLGGRLYVEATAHVMGKVKAGEGGETKIEPGAKAMRYS